jgi:hypothetical protein
MGQGTRSLTFGYDFNQLYLHDGELPDEGNPYLEALDDANENGRSIGLKSGVVDILMPRRENFAASMQFRLLAEAPSLRSDADHVVEFDLALPSGRLILEGSGGSGKEEIQVPSGAYRARLSGQDFEAAAAWQYDDSGDPADCYTLELWPSDVPGEPIELRRWKGYDHRFG